MRDVACVCCCALMCLLAGVQWVVAQPRLGASTTISDPFSAPGRKWFGGFGVAHVRPYGKIKLVRGTRKVVRTDFTGDWEVHADVGYRLRPNLEFGLNVRYARFTYADRTDYADGYIIDQQDDFGFAAVLARLTRTFDLKPVAPFVGVELGYIIYSGEVNLMSELHLVGQDPLPPHPDFLTPFDLDPFNTVGIGVHAGLRKQLGNSLFADLTVDFLAAKFIAKILNDPEDDGSHDVDLWTNPLSFGITVGTSL